MWIKADLHSNAGPQRDLEACRRTEAPDPQQTFYTLRGTVITTNGTFGIKYRMPKKARNPGTGEAVYLPERFVPTFKPSKLMRSRVNELINK